MAKELRGEVFWLNYCSTNRWLSFRFFLLLVDNSTIHCLFFIVVYLGWFLLWRLFQLTIQSWKQIIKNDFCTFFYSDTKHTVKLMPKVIQSRSTSFKKNAKIKNLGNSKTIGGKDWRSMPIMNFDLAKARNPLLSQSGHNLSNNSIFVHWNVE
jgi:hypothetical protein